MTKKTGGFWRGIFLFLLGVTAGMGVAASIAVYVNKLHLPFIEKSQTQPDKGEAILNGEESDSFRFRDLLRQQQKIEPLHTEKAADAPIVESRTFVYFLQVGAFRNSDTAEELRGRLALTGKAVQIKQGTSAAGDDLFRIWVGPFKDEDTAEVNRAQLALEGYANVSLLKTAQ